MSCILSIIGENLDIDMFNEECRIPGFEKKYKGDLISVRLQQTRQFSELNLMLSPAGFDRFNEQLSDATRFLHEQQDKLKLIATFPGIDWATLSFGINSTVDHNSLAQTLYLPPAIVELCGLLKIGVELAMYHPEMNKVLASKYIS
jgi:hypothetical protein